MDLISDLDSLRATPQTNVAEPGSKTDELGRDQFLRIFLTQLQSQDPLNPEDSSALGAQLAQFSQLEQQVSSTTELKGIRESLGELIELTRGGTGSGARLDPVSLIGREIEFPADTVRTGVAGTDAALSAQLTDDRTGLVIQVVDVASGEAGVYTLSTGRRDPILPLPRGTYTLTIEGAQARLDGPSSAGAAPFTTLALSGDTLVEARDANGRPIEFQFQEGRQYRFSVQAIDLSGEQTPIELPTVRTALADSVQIVDGTPRILAAGTIVDPADIRGIRAAGTPR